jgi:hypothetical protein
MGSMGSFVNQGHNSASQAQTSSSGQMGSMNSFVNQGQIPASQAQTSSSGQMGSFVNQGQIPASQAHGSFPVCPPQYFNQQHAQAAHPPHSSFSQNHGQQHAQAFHGQAQTGQQVAAPYISPPVPGQYQNSGLSQASGVYNQAQTAGYGSVQQAHQQQAYPVNNASRTGQQRGPSPVSHPAQTQQATPQYIPGVGAASTGTYAAQRNVANGNVSRVPRPSQASSQPSQGQVNEP